MMKGGTRLLKKGPGSPIPGVGSRPEPCSIPYFYENQTITAEKVINFIKEQMTIMCILIIAQMQSGKTGTYLLVAIDLILSDEMEHVLIISGSNDKSLKAQTTQDLKDAIKEKCIKLVDGEEYTNNVKEKKLTERITIQWSQDLNKNEPVVNDNTCIIHDESHYAQSKKNIPGQFYKRNGIDKSLYGDHSKLIERNIRIIEVSATPFSAIISNEKVLRGEFTGCDGKSLSEKKIFFSKPGNSYIGISDFITKGKLHFTAASIADIISENARKYDKKYILVRTPKCAGKHGAPHPVKQIANDTGCEYITVFKTTKGQDASKSFDFLKEEPTTRTLVHICGKARMGQVLDKTFIGMVYETVIKPNTDTICQGLPGRMCGYYESDIPDIYVSLNSEKGIRDFAKAWDNNEMDHKKFLKINKAMNLKGRPCSKTVNGKQQDEHGNWWQQSVSIKFKLSQLEKDHDGKINIDNIEKTDLINLFEDYPQLIVDNPDNVIDNCLKDLEYSVKNHNMKTNELMIEFDLKEKLEKTFLSKERSYCGYPGWGSVHEGKAIKTITVLRDGNGWAYMICNIPFNGIPDIQISSINTKCNHDPSVEAESDDCDMDYDDFNGGQVINMSFKETAHNLDHFKEFIRECIKRTIPNEPSYVKECSRGINTMCLDGQKIKGIYVDKRIIDRNGINRIQDEFNREFKGIKFRFQKFIETDKLGYRKMKYVTW